MDDSWIEEWPFLFPVWSWGTPSAERERSLVDFDEIGRADTGLDIKYFRQNNIPGSAQYCSIFHSDFFLIIPPHLVFLTQHVLSACCSHCECVDKATMTGTANVLFLRVWEALDTIIPMCTMRISAWLEYLEQFCQIISFLTGSVLVVLWPWVHYNATGLLKWFLKVRNNLSIYGLNKWQHIFVIKHGIICALCQPWL